MPPNPPEVRLLGADDAPAYQALRLRGLREYPQAFTSSAEQEAARPLEWARRRLAADAARPHDFFLGACDGDRLCGVVGLEGRYRPKERHNASLVGMVVAPECAGQGTGRVLVEALVRRARMFPALTQIDLTVTAGNDRARRLYEACGFRLVGVLPRAIRVDGRYHDKLQMQLQL
jgi:RimJ/RimL family protein N-acetyltransferase